MTERQLRKLAHEIRLMKDVVPDGYRLVFAQSIRDVIQMSRDFPGWTHFLQECQLAGDEKLPELPAR